MNSLKFYTPGHSDALVYAAAVLEKKGCQFALQPDASVTHLLLGVPSFEYSGTLKGGGNIDVLLKEFSPSVKVMGGNLQHPALEGYATADLLQDPLYLAENARITAHCAVKAAINRLPVTIYGQQVLVIGWGRIGKCLAQLLHGMGARVTVAARKECDRAMVLALGCDAIDSNTLSYELIRFRVIFNTAPEPVLTEDAMQYCAEDCLKIDLASRPGLAGDDVLWARGLPGKDAPETSGELIARTVLRLR